MARIRSIKPGFFANEELAELSPWHRLCYVGLWTLADREGRLEDRPRRIKAAIFPYDELNVNDLLDGLAAKGFVRRYTADGVAYLAIPTFVRHQRPKVDEYPSAIPAPLSEDSRGNERGRARIKDIGDRIKDIGTEGEGADGALAPADGAGSLRKAADGAGAQRWADDFAELWNTTTTPPIARCRELTTKRRRHIKTRLTEHPLTEWADVFARLERSSFCKGENDRRWIASFDWVIGSPDVAVKVLEGKYDNRDAASASRRVLTPWKCHHTNEPCADEAACRARDIEAIRTWKPRTAS